MIVNIESFKYGTFLTINEINILDLKFRPLIIYSSQGKPLIVRTLTYVFYSIRLKALAVASYVKIEFKAFLFLD